jgi:hypothetical protein
MPSATFQYLVTKAYFREALRHCCASLQTRNSPLTTVLTLLSNSTTWCRRFVSNWRPVILPRKGKWNRIVFVPLAA